MKVNPTTTLSDKDYKVVYVAKDRTNAKAVSNEDVVVKIVGTGDYTGSVVLGKFDINQAVIKADNVTVPKTVQYDGSLQSPEEYMAGKVTVKATTTVDKKDKVIEVPADAYKLEYTVTNSLNAATTELEVGNKITTKLTSSNKNKNFGVENTVITKDKATTISNKSLSDENVKMEVVGGPYTYTGKAIIPTLKVTVDGVELALNRDYKVLETGNSIKAGAASVTVVGMNDYSGSQTVKFTIEKAKLADVKVVSIPMQ